MFNKDKEAKTKESPESFETVIGENTVIEGNIRCAASLRIDGKLHGDVNAEGAVHIGKAGEIKGKVKARQLYLAGTIKGNAQIKEVLRITSSGKLVGDGETKTLIVDENGIFDGKSKMLKSTDPKQDIPPEGKIPPSKGKEKKES